MRVPAVSSGAPTAPGRLVLFPGQSSQRVGMAQSAVTRSPQASAFFDQASSAIGRDLRELCWHTSAEVLTRTENVQPALVAASLAQWIAASADESFAPNHADIFAGHSLGSLAAAAAAGYLDPVTAVALAARRGRIMADAPSGGAMLEVFTSPEPDPAAQQAVGQELADRFGVDLAAVNGPTEIALAGSVDRIDHAACVLSDHAVTVPVSNAFHSRYMTPIAHDWAAALDAAGIAPEGSPYLGCAAATVTTQGPAVVTDLKLSLENPVLWHHLMTQTQAITTITIFGPSRVLLRLAQPYREDRTITVFDDVPATRSPVN